MTPNKTTQKLSQKRHVFDILITKFLAYPVSLYPYKIIHAGCMMHQIMNNLDYAIAQYPNELVTYGGNGQVFSNWIQFRLCLHYLAELDNDQTLVMSSGHPVGLFPSAYESPS